MSFPEADRMRKVDHFFSSRAWSHLTVVLWFEELDRLNQIHPWPNPSMKPRSQSHCLVSLQASHENEWPRTNGRWPCAYCSLPGFRPKSWAGVLLPNLGLSLVCRLCLTIRPPKRGIMLLSCSVSLWSEYDMSHTGCCCGLNGYHKGSGRAATSINDRASVFPRLDMGCHHPRPYPRSRWDTGISTFLFLVNHPLFWDLWLPKGRGLGERWSGRWGWADVSYHI